MARAEDTARRWPVAAWLPGYRRSRLGKDSIGALTAWALIVPECVAYAQIAGVPIQNAFYAAPVALIVYALIGTSNHLIVGATSAASVLSASTVSAVSRVEVELWLAHVRPRKPGGRILPEFAQQGRFFPDIDTAVRTFQAERGAKVG